MIDVENIEEDSMTIRTVDKIECECGHTGLLRMSENDQPYSTPWVKRTLEGFVGTVSDNGELEKVSCLRCGKIGKVIYSNRPEMG